MPAWRSLRPGWYLLAAVVLYGAVVTVVAARRGEMLDGYRQLPQGTESGAVAAAPEPARGEDGLWFPLPGAELPQNPAHLPNAVRAYRQGVSEGFDFYDGDSGVPVPYGVAVIAAASGTVVRIDSVYREPVAEEWQQLMASVDDGASEEELDRLRGRQVWLETDGGKLLRYAHLSAVRDGMAKGQRVERGWVIGFVGNSGTDEGVAGTQRGSRLHFEVWEGESFFGEGMEPEEALIAAASLFTGP